MTASMRHCIHRLSRLAVIAWFCLRAAPAAASEPSDGVVKISAELDREVMGAEDGALLTITIHRPEAQNGTFLAPEPADFEIVPVPKENTSTPAYSLATSRSYIQESRSFLLKPNRIGKLAIPPARFTLGDVTVASQPLKVLVVEGSLGHAETDIKGILHLDRAAPDPLAAAGFEPASPKDAACKFPSPSGPGERVVKDGEAFLRSFVDKKLAYVGEQVTWSVVLFSRVHIKGVDRFEPPSLDGFWSEDTAKPKEVSSENRTLRGKCYWAYVLRKTALFPIRPGKLAIDAVKASVSIKPNSRWQATSLPIALQVSPLPTAARQAPAIVGRWDVAVGAPSAGPGNTKILRLTIEGAGNVRWVAPPPPPLIAGISLSEPKMREVTLKSGDKLGGRRFIDYSIKAEGPGVYQVPSVSLDYFDPWSRSVKRSSSRPFQMRVEAGENPDSLAGMPPRDAVPSSAFPPVEPATPSEGSARGMDVVFALDLSTSMLALDFKPGDRITAAKAGVLSLAQWRHHDRLGFVAFAGTVSARADLSLDRQRLEEQVTSASPGKLEDGTAIGDALATSLRLLCQLGGAGAHGNLPEAIEACRVRARKSAIILFTDGDGNAGRISANDAAAAAKALGVPVFTIMVGKGGMVQYPAGGGTPNPRFTSEVEIAVNPSLLKAIASTTGGSSCVCDADAAMENCITGIARQLDETSARQTAPAQRVSTDILRLLEGTLRFGLASDG